MRTRANTLWIALPALVLLFCSSTRPAAAQFDPFGPRITATRFALANGRHDDAKNQIEACSGGPTSDQG